MKTVQSFYDLLETDADEQRPDDIEILLPPGQKPCIGCDD